MNNTPTDLNDAINILMSELSESDLTRIKDGYLTDFNMNLGMNIRSNWKLWDNSKLAQWFAERGVRHADGASTIILTTLQRILNKEDIRLDEQISIHQD